MLNVYVFNLMLIRGEESQPVLKIQDRITKDTSSANGALMEMFLFFGSCDLLVSFSLVISM